MSVFCTLIDESVNGQNHESLQSLDQLHLAGSDGVFLTHPALHHLVKLIAGHERIRVSSESDWATGEPPPTW